MKYEEAVSTVQAVSAGEQLESGILLQAGNVLYKNGRRGSHVCYQNDNFYAAVMCGFEEKRLRFAAAQVLNNALIGYWEWQTHAGWDMQIAMQKLKISHEDIPLVSTNHYLDYCRLPWSLCLLLAEKFQLPYKSTSAPHPQDVQLRSDLRYWWRDENSPGKHFVAFEL